MGAAIGNRLYKYQLVNNQLVNKELLLDLPVNDGTQDNGGPVLIGPDNNVYGVIGQVAVAGAVDKGHETKAQNFENGPDADGTSGIHRVTQDGNIVGTPILGSNPPLDSYYAYGIRNVFGMDFDPITGKLWISENGVSTNDEINLVEPGFNGGWKDLTGLAPSGFNYNGLVTFDGKGIYSDPEFVWGNTVSPTALLFLNTDKFGTGYKNDVFVGDYKFGRIYHFDLNPERNALLLGGSLADKVANSDTELQGNIFAEGFGIVTDLEIGPDGLLYVTSHTDGTIYRISDNTGGGGTDAVLPVTSVTASGNDGNVPSNAFDNNLGTRWSNLGVGSFITANLGSAKTVSSVDIAWYNGASRTNTFVISTSTDGTAFTQRFTGTSALSSGFQNYDIADVSAQYVRVTVNGNSQNNWASISEIRIHGVITGSFMAS